jgi:hypothetical protein
MRKLVRAGLALFQLIIVSVVSAQTGISGGVSGSQSEFPQYSPNILPASPDATGFTRYGNLPVGLNTGTAQFSLPVYTIQSGSLSHSVGINYSSNGVKVDEMATRVGINWNLKAGGMITRAVMDMPDEATAVYPTFYHGPIVTDTSNPAIWDLYDYVKQASYATRPDYQPDEYSFNIDGYSGKFLKRENGQFTQFTSSGVKIEQNSSGFILTAPTGIKYYFYLTETAKNYSYPETTVLEWIPTPVPTAWYLTKILSPARDSIVFNYTDSAMTYKNGISQDFPTGTPDGYYLKTDSYERMDKLTKTPTVPSMNTLVQVTDNQARRISSIVFSNGTVEFKYSSRMDVPGEKKLDSIKVKRSGDNTLIRCMALQYTYSNAAAGSYDTYIVSTTNYTNTDSSLRKRLFLTSFDEVATDLSGKQRHSFEYDDMNGLPPRLSFSQDRHGSFNGKVNAWFFPNDTWYDKVLAGNFFGGDRTYNFNAAKKGMLKKITYPTGGHTQFTYEPNKTEDEYAFKYYKDSVSAVIDTSSSVNQEFLSDTIYHDGQKGLRLRGYCQWASNPVYACEGEGGGCTDLDDQYYISFQIINVATNVQCNVDFCSSTVAPGGNFAFGLFGTNLAAGTYRIKAIASRPRLRAKITLERYWKTVDRSDSSGVAGVRVKYISDFANDNTETNRREFIYGSWNAPDSSSGTGLTFDANNGREVGMTRIIATDVWNNSSGITVAYYSGYNTIHSNSLLTNFITENSTVLYKKVIELNIHPSDSTKNNGGTEYEFFYDKKKYPLPLAFAWGTQIWHPVPVVPGTAPYMNNDYRTGMMKSSKVFTYAQKKGARAVLQETNNYYSLDTANLVIDTFLVSKEVLKREDRNPNWPHFFDYDLYRYWRYFGFLKQDSAIQKSYSHSGELVNKVIFLDYDDHNYKPNNVRVYSSNNDIKSITRKYTCDVGVFDTDYSIYNPMKQANMIDNLLEEKNHTTDGVSTTIELSKKKMNYSLSLGLYLPSSAYSSQKAGTEYQEIAYQLYDSSGNLLQYTGRDGVINSIIWGYDKNYPVAKVVGKTYNDALSQSSINMTVVNNPSSESAMKTELDKLRTLSSSFVTTYIYSPLIGLTSQADPNGIITYYEYDNFNRLSLIRDKDRNVIKKICYNFQGQPADCGYGSLAAWQPMSSTCQQSNGANTGNLIVTEKDMNPVSGTYNQTRTVTIADSRACPVPSACSGLDKKIINGICETGTKVCTGDFRPPGQGWQHYYHYEWSDSSISDTYIGQGIGCMEL